MKDKALLFLATCLIGFSCENKELGMPAASEETAAVQVAFDWRGIAQSEIPTADGMRVNIFGRDNLVRDYGVDDIAYTGGTVHLVKEASYMTLAYTYQGNNIYFRNESDRDLIEAYCNAQTRTTYTRSFPEEETYSEPTGLFYTGRHELCVARAGAVIPITPESRLYTYTFEVRGIEGAEFISEVRGAISGMSKSFFIGQGQPNPVPATVLFTASVDKANGKITGSFRTFGRLDTENNFTIEILYPSNTGGIVQYSWDVTGQIDRDGYYQIIIDNSGIVIPDEGGDAASGWQVDLDDWNDQFVPLG